MTIIAILLLTLAGALRTRLGRLWLATWLLRAGNGLADAGSRVLDRVRQEMRR